ATLEGGSRRSDLEQAERSHRISFALDLERAKLLEASGLADESPREPADDDLSRRCRSFEPLRDADGVAGDEPLPRSLLGDQHLARLEADADVEANAELGGKRLVERGDSRLDLERRWCGAERVVLVRDGYAEHGHHGIARELLHRASVPREHGRDE